MPSAVRLSHPKWGNSTRNLSGGAFKAAFLWAASPGKGGAIITKNPLDGMPLPTMRKRSAEGVVSEDEFAGLLELVKSEAVRDTPHARDVSPAGFAPGEVSPDPLTHRLHLRSPPAHRVHRRPS